MYSRRLTPERGEVISDPARKVAEVLRHEGRRVKLLRTTFVAQEVTCLCVYEASSAEDVREAARRAGPTWDRVVEAVTQPDQVAGIG